MPLAIPFAGADLEQVFRLVQPADEVQSHGGRAGWGFGGGMRHTRGLLGGRGQRQQCQHGDGK